jgi:SAM-dependent methyltransferase
MSGALFHEAMWSQRYRDAGETYLFGTAPNAYLVSHAGLLAGCHDVLCVADGEGRNSVWLAERGFSVTAQEISPVALQKARALAAERSVVVTFEARDILAGEWPVAAFDAVIAVFIQFAAPRERACLFEGLKRTIRPGGVVLVLGYTPAQLEYRTGGPSAAENLYTPELMREFFADWKILRLDEYEAVLEEGTGHNGRSALLGLVARKPT